MDVVKLYEERVASGVLRADPVQHAALTELERIRAALAKPVKTGFFRMAPEPIKGLNLWGGVGRGTDTVARAFRCPDPRPDSAR